MLLSRIPIAAANRAVALKCSVSTAFVHETHHSAYHTQSASEVLRGIITRSFTNSFATVAFKQSH